MHTHEDKGSPLDDTKRGAKLAKQGRKGAKKYSNKQNDRFKKAQLKRG